MAVGAAGALAACSAKEGKRVPFEAPCFAGTQVERTEPFAHTGCVLERRVVERGLTCSAGATPADSVHGAFARFRDGSIAVCVLDAPAELGGVALPVRALVTFHPGGGPRDAMVFDDPPLVAGARCNGIQWQGGVATCAMPTRVLADAAPPPPDARIVDAGPAADAAPVAAGKPILWYAEATGPAGTVKFAMPEIVAGTNAATEYRLMQHRDAIASCHVPDELEGGTMFSGSLTLTVEIDPRGIATSVAVTEASPTIPEPVQSCIRAMMKDQPLDNARPTSSTVVYRLRLGL